MLFVAGVGGFQVYRETTGYFTRALGPWLAFGSSRVLVQYLPETKLVWPATPLAQNDIKVTASSMPVSQACPVTKGPFRSLRGTVTKEVRGSERVERPSGHLRLRAVRCP